MVDSAEEDLLPLKIQQMSHKLNTEFSTDPKM